MIVAWLPQNNRESFNQLLLVNERIQTVLVTGKLRNDSNHCIWHPLPMYPACFRNDMAWRNNCSKKNISKPIYLKKKNIHFQKHKPQGNNVASIKLRHFSKKKNKAFPSFRPKPSPIARLLKREELFWLITTWSSLVSRILQTCETLKLNECNTYTPIWPNQNISPT